MNGNKIIFVVLFVSGLLTALGTATLLFLGIIESGIAGMIGIVGIGLISASALGFVLVSDSESKR